MPWGSWGGEGTLSGPAGGGGTLPGPAGGGVPWLGEYPGQGGTLVRYPPPARSGWGVPWLGGTLVRYPPGQVRMGGYPARGGGTQLGQQKEYSLHGGRYASCVHAGGLSCDKNILNKTFPHMYILSSIRV